MVFIFNEVTKHSNFLFYFAIGSVLLPTIQSMKDDEFSKPNTVEDERAAMAFLNQQFVFDKTVDDAMEALIDIIYYVKVDCVTYHFKIIGVIVPSQFFITEVV